MPAHAETAEDLACRLSPQANPTGYQSWWDRVPKDSTYTTWFWSDIVPHANTACRRAVQDTLWNRAVPENWADVPNIGGWSWASGGYYTQTLWLHAVPDGWAPVANIGGWHAPTGGYYTQVFWLRAIPENWAPIPDVGDWPWATGGYYTQWFWLDAVPDNWADVPNIGGWSWASGGYYTQWFWLRAVPDNWAKDGNFSLGRGPVAQDEQGYYRYWFWEGAVPGNWKFVGNVDEWLWSSGGYYTQWFWLHATVDQWALNQQMAVGGQSPKGYYDFWFYHYATVRDFAWDPGLEAGSGYYDHWFHGLLGEELGHYKSLLAAAAGFLPTQLVDQPVSKWFAPATKAVVVLTFDHEDTRAQGCAVTSKLRNLAVPATFNLTGYTAEAIAADSTWKACLKGFDLSVGNHTQNHPGASELDARTLMNTLPLSEQTREFNLAEESIHKAFPEAQINSFRTPWCDGRRAFDVSTATAMLAAASEPTDPLVLGDSSLNTVGGTLPPLIGRGMQRFSLADYPFPFVARTSGNRKLIEVPFSYPSDYVLGAFHGIDPSSAGPVGSQTASGQWKAALDKVYARGGVMVVLLHPWLQDQGNALSDFVSYVKAKPGATFSTMSQVTSLFAANS